MKILHIIQGIALYFPVIAYAYILVQKLYIYWGVKEYLIASAIQIVAIFVFYIIEEYNNKTQQEKQEEIEIKAFEEFLETLP